MKYFENGGDTLRGYRAVHVNWKDLDFCSVCDMDEVNDPNPVLMLIQNASNQTEKLLKFSFAFQEYEDNLFLQCDKCRMMVYTYRIIQLHEYCQI